MFMFSIDRYKYLNSVVNRLQELICVFIHQNMENLRSVGTRTRRKKVFVDFIDGPSDGAKNITLRKWKKTPNQTNPQFVVPEVVDQIVDLEEVQFRH